MSVTPGTADHGIPELDTLRVIAHRYKAPTEIVAFLRCYGTPGAIRFPADMLTESSTNPVNWRLQQEFNHYIELTPEDWDWLRGVWETRMEVFE